MNPRIFQFFEKQIPYLSQRPGYDANCKGKQSLNNSPLCWVTFPSIDTVHTCKNPSPRRRK